MDLKKFDIRHMPIWTQGLINELEEPCWREVKQECVPYNQIADERDTLLQRYPFISVLYDGDKITAPMQLNIQEAKALSEYLTLDMHKRDMEIIQMYLLGCRHMTEWFELIEVI